ncbi:MAG TPA: DUF2292 domain-containing protein [Anaerolineae bacterium]|nr:DUF2292 domain-containing protein [Anaerolineae bacterium]
MEQRTIPDRHRDLDAVAELHRRNREQCLTSAETLFLAAVRRVCSEGFGEVTVLIHEGRVTRIVRSESIKLTA